MSRVQEVFCELIDLPPDVREAHITRLCGEDEALEEQVRELLMSYEEAGGFLASPTDGGGSSDIAEMDTIEQHADDLPARTIGRYKLLERIGEGGFGVVFMAEQTEPVKRRVALKIIKLGMDTKQVIARFEAERQALAMMDHPNIARVLDAGATETGRPFFVMELVRGVPITEYCDDNNLDTQQRLDLFRKVCLAVQHAHHKGVIHRDIKPTNVLVTLHDGTPVPKVIDFGIAKATNAELTEKTLFTEFKQMVGTPQYMSPEQAEMSGLDIDTRSDVYSLGVLLYELLTGTTPFDARRLRRAGLNEIQRIIRDETPPKPSTRLSSLSAEASVDDQPKSGEPSIAKIASHRKTDANGLRRQMRGDLDWIVMKAMEKDRDRRYETANGFAKDIERYLKDEPVLAGPPGAGYRLKKMYRRNKGLVAAMAGIAAALLLAVGALSWGLVKVRAERDAKVAALEEAEEQTRLARIAEAEAEEQAEIATSVNDFLNEDILLALRPRGTPNSGRNVTIKQVLDAARSDLYSSDGRLHDKPRIRASTHMSIGRSLFALGELVDAHAELAVAASLFTETGGVNDGLAIVADTYRFDVLLRDAKLAEAEILIRSLVERCTTLYGRNHLTTLYRLWKLGTLLTKRNQLDAAEFVLLEAIEGTTDLRGTDAHPHIVSMKEELATTYRRMGQIEKARNIQEDVLVAKITLYGPDHPYTLNSQNNLGNLLQAEGRITESVDVFTEVAERRTVLLGPDHPDTLSATFNLASAYGKLGQHLKAFSILEQLYTTQSRVLGATHPHTATTALAAATSLLESGKTADAYPYAVMAAEVDENTYGEKHPYALESKLILARVLQTQDKLTEAHSVATEVLAGRREIWGDDDVRTVRAADLVSQIEARMSESASTPSPSSHPPTPPGSSQSHSPK